MEKNQLYDDRIRAPEKEILFQLFFREKFVIIRCYNLPVFFLSILSFGHKIFFYPSSGVTKAQKVGEEIEISEEIFSSLLGSVKRAKKSAIR